jgi:hypothetical protein
MAPTHVRPLSNTRARQRQRTLRTTSKILLCAIRLSEFFMSLSFIRPPNVRSVLPRHYTPTFRF